MCSIEVKCELSFQSDSATPFGIGGRRSQTPLGMMGVGTMRTPYNPGAGGLGKYIGVWIKISPLDVVTAHVCFLILCLSVYFS